MSGRTRTDGLDIDDPLLFPDLGGNLGQRTGVSRFALRRIECHRGPTLVADLFGYSSENLNEYEQHSEERPPSIPWRLHVFRLLCAIDSALSPLASLPSAMSQKSKILIVDPNRLNLDSISHTLASSGYAVFQAENGSDALDSARKNCPDLVLFGATLPDVESAEIGQRIKTDPDLADVLAVHLPSEPSSINRQNRDPSRGEPDIPSSVRDEELLDRIQSLARMQRAEAALRREAERRSTTVATQQEIAAAAPDPAAIMQLVADRSQTLTGADGAVVELVEGEEMVYRAVSGSVASQIGLRLGTATSFSGLCVRTDEFLRCDDAESDPRVHRELSHLMGARSILVVPLKHQYNSVGVLKVISGKPNAFGDADAQTLQLVAHFMAAAVNQAVTLGAKQSLLAEHTRTIVALKESEERFRSAFEYAAIGMALVGIDGRWLRVNQTLCEILGYSKVEMLNHSFHDFTNPEDLESDKGHVRRLLRGDVRSYQTEMRYYHKLSSIVWVLLSVSLLRSSREEPLYLIAQIQNITERKRGEESIVMQARVLQNMSEGVCLADENGLIVYANAAEEEMFGYTPKELIGQRVALLTQSSTDENHSVAEITEHVRTKSAWFGECTNQRKDGSRFTTSSNMSVLEISGRKYLVCVQEDITEKKRADEQIKKSLKEKDILLKEIHHRVKNNLQVISSLLSLQSGYIDDKRTQELFRDSQNRVRSMALIHEKLYQAQDLAKVDFREYALSLVAMLFRSYGTNSGSIKLNLAVDQLFLSIDTAIPIGLVINELVSNSLKYAFPNGRSGSISIDFHEGINDQFTLVFRDDGAGMPKEFDFDKTPTLGLRLVKILTHQIGGELVFHHQGGTEFSITFKEVKEREKNNHG